MGKPDHKSLIERTNSVVIQAIEKAYQNSNFVPTSSDLVVKTIEERDIESKKA